MHASRSFGPGRCPDRRELGPRRSPGPCSNVIRTPDPDDCALDSDRHALKEPGLARRGRCAPWSVGLGSRSKRDPTDGVSRETCQRRHIEPQSLTGWDDTGNTGQGRRRRPGDGTVGAGGRRLAGAACSSRVAVVSANRDANRDPSDTTSPAPDLCIRPWGRPPVASPSVRVAPTWTLRHVPVLGALMMSHPSRGAPADGRGRRVRRRHDWSPYKAERTDSLSASPWHGRLRRPF